MGKNKRAAVIAVLTMVCAMVVALTVIDRRSAAMFRQDLEVYTHHVTTVLHDRIAARVEHDVATLRSLAHSSTVTSEDPAERFDAFAEYHLEQTDHFISIGFAPDFRLQKLYPSQWVSNFPREKIRAMIEARLSALVQSGAAASLTEAPIVETSADGTMMLIVPIKNAAGQQSTTEHGAIILIIDRTRFLESANAHPDTALAQDPHGVEFAIRDKQAGQPVAGSQTLADDQPVVKALSLPGSEWEIMATPQQGWNATHAAQWSFRTTLGIAALSMLLPIFVAGALLSERNKNIEALRARESKLLDISQRFKLAMDSSNIGIWEIEEGISGCFLDERSAGLHGFPMHEKTLSLTEWLTAIVPEDRSKTEAFFFNCTCGTQTYSEVYRIARSDGTVRYLRSAGANYEKSGGERQTTGIIWDVTADMLMAQTLRESKDTSDIKNAELELALDELSSREHDLEELSGRLKLALESYNCGIWESTQDYSSAIWNERMCELYGLPPEPERHVNREDYLNCLLPDERTTALTNAVRKVDDPDRVSTQRVLLPDGSIRHVKAVGRLHSNRDGTRKIVGIAFDVTADVLLSEQLNSAKNEAEAKNAELELAKTRIEHNALHDPLTGLPNRRKLDQELDELSSSSSGERRRFALLHLDLDRFKQINDTLGHAAGDAMLVHTAKMLLQNVRSDDLVARIGGDEFVILVRQIGDKDHLKSVAAKIIAAFRHPFDFEGFACRCGVSIGIAFGEGHHVDARKTLINADLALYRAKAMGRNRYEFFTQNLQAELISNKRTADEILTGLENHEFETWYQPQFCAKSNDLVGVEALVRWRHPSRGLLTPDKFLKIAEELNVVSVIDHLVLQTALQQKRLWNMRGIDIPKVSVNVSARRLNDDYLIDSLNQLHIQPGEVAFELVESIFLDESEDTTAINLEKIKALGIDIEIDDFGTGHTSIISLLRLKPNRLKIDRQLVMPILSSPQERSMVRSIIDIARSLGVETVAEGVETMEHATLLRQMGCDVFQGYAFSAPLPAADFSAFAVDAKWRKVS